VLGTAAWDSLLANPRVWHVAFHGARDVAERLVTGRERLYLQQFFESRAYRDELVAEGFDHYVRAYEAPGALRAAFEAYRALPADAAYNRMILGEKKLPMPVLVLAGQLSNSAGILSPMCADIARNAEFREIPEEQPERLLEVLSRFLALEARPVSHE
jgi:pimeloyl-ACP methyl ester carboxylesterase